MPTGKERVTIIAHVDFLYSSVESMPWQDIEKAAGKAFSVKERLEVYECAREYSWELGLQKEGVSPKKIDALREDILSRARGLREIWSYRTQFDFGRDKEPKDVSGRLALQALGVLHGDDGGPSGLYKELRRADMFSKRLIELLESQPIATMNPTRTLPETAALTIFIGATLNGASESPARGNTVWTPAVEKTRWGIPVGPKSEVFCRFASAVLQQEFKLHQITAAHGEA